MSVVFTEKLHAAAFIINEEELNYSRDTIVIASGAGVLQPGTVLGKITKGTATAAAKSGGNTGNGVFTIDGTTPVLANAKVGVYQVRCTAAATNSGTFAVYDPEGDMIGSVLVGATFADQIKFAIADGSADFAVGDGFDVTVAAGSGKYAPSPATAVNGSDVASALNIYGVDATSADVAVAAITRQSTVNINLLTYDASVSGAGPIAAKVSQLRAAGIIPR